MSQDGTPYVRSSVAMVWRMCQLQWLTIEAGYYSVRNYKMWKQETFNSTSFFIYVCIDRMPIASGYETKKNH